MRKGDIGSTGEMDGGKKKKEKGNEERIEEGKMRQGSKCVNKGRGKASIQGQEKRKGM